jgi:hypothetical protein
MVVALRHDVAVPAMKADRPVEMARVEDVAPEMVKPVERGPRHIPRLPVNASALPEPLVVRMFTDDPDVVIYWIADTRVNKRGKEVTQ